MHDEREDAVGMAEDSLNAFELVYKTKWLTMMGSKLGLFQAEKGDEKLVTDMLDWMHENKTDFNNTFRDLSNGELPDEEPYATQSVQAWNARWQERIRKEEQDLESSFALMRSVNPAVIPRNHKVEDALQAGEEGNLEPFHELLKALENPYEDGDHLQPYQTPPKPEEKVLQTFCGT